MMGADILATQEARASVTIISTRLNQIDSVPHVKLINSGIIVSI